MHVDLDDLSFVFDLVGIGRTKCSSDEQSNTVMRI